jgi:hypothetical protein
MKSELDTSRFTDISPRKAAIVAGLGLLIMTILAVIANFSVLQNLIVPEDATATASNILASTELFRIGICCLLIVAILDVVVAWALYIFLKPVNRSFSLLAAWFRVVYAAIFVTAMNNLLIVLQLLNDVDYLKVFETNQLQAQVMLSLNAFTSGWNIGLAIFGLHLLLVGYLAFKSSYIPKLLGILLIIAGLGYLTDSLGKILIPNYDISITMFTFIGEAVLMLWLLWRGIKGFDEELVRKN